MSDLRICAKSILEKEGFIPTVLFKAVDIDFEGNDYHVEITFKKL